VGHRKGGNKVKKEDVWRCINDVGKNRRWLQSVSVAQQHTYSFNGDDT
jgi:hypothetical protein